jgi:hypothetical protein
VETKNILYSVWGDDNTSNNQMMRNTIVKLNKIFDKGIYLFLYPKEICCFFEKGRFRNINNITLSKKSA